MWLCEIREQSHQPFAWNCNARLGITTAENVLIEKQPDEIATCLREPGKFLLCEYSGRVCVTTPHRQNTFGKCNNSCLAYFRSQSYFTKRTMGDSQFCFIRAAACLLLGRWNLMNHHALASALQHQRQRLTIFKYGQSKKTAFTGDGEGCKDGAWTVFQPKTKAALSDAS